MSARCQSDVQGARLIRARSTIRFVIAMAALCALHIAASAQQSEQIDLTVQKWLNEPARRELPAAVSLSPARLTFEQRLVLAVRLTFAANQIQKLSEHRDLHLIIKAGDGKQWFAGTSYTHLELKQVVDPHQEFEFIANMYVRPGKHLLGIVLYDSVMNQRTVFKRMVEIPEIKHDPMPQLDRDLPPVEFLPGNGEGSPEDFQRRLRTSGREPGMMNGRPRGPVPLPGDYDPYIRGRRQEPEVAKSAPDLIDPGNKDRRVELAITHPTEIEVLINFTPSDQYSGSNHVVRRTASVFWEVTHVLSQLHAPNACVWLTGIDVIGRRVLFEHIHGADVNWGELSAAVAKVDPNTVDVTTLQGRTLAAQFFRQQVERMISRHDKECAEARGADPQRVYLIAASGIMFPRGTQRDPVEATSADAPHLYYFRANLIWNDQWDEMEKIVKPLQPRLFNINDPFQFRKALASLLADMETNDARSALLDK